VTPERWQRIIRLMDETFEDYLAGLATLRKRVVEDMRRKIREGSVLDHPREGSPVRSAPARRRR